MHLLRKCIGGGKPPPYIEMMAMGVMEMKHPIFVTTPEVSRRMGRVRLKKGKAERLLGKALWHSGFRYRYNVRGLPGSPDLVIRKFSIAIFIDGEFWHGKDWERRKPRLKSNREYWIEKIEENMARDQRNDAALREMGWTVLRFWEKDVKKDVDRCASAVIGAVVQRWEEYIDGSFTEKTPGDPGLVLDLGNVSPGVPQTGTEALFHDPADGAQG